VSLAFGAAAHRQFFSLTELNQAIGLLLGELNDKPMAPPQPAQSV
jgi:hypothetical protein